MAFRLFGFDFGHSVESSFKDLGREMGGSHEPSQTSELEAPPAKTDQFNSSNNFRESNPPVSPMSQGKEKFFRGKV